MRGLTVAAVLIGASLAGCGDHGGATPATEPTATPAPDGGAVIDPGDGASLSVDLDPAAFSCRVDHPYLPRGDRGEDRRRRRRFRPRGHDHRRRAAWFGTFETAQSTVE
jgi:hypothetical protein